MLGYRLQQRPETLFRHKAGQQNNFFSHSLHWMLYMEKSCKTFKSPKVMVLCLMIHSAHITISSSHLSLWIQLPGCLWSSPQHSPSCCRRLVWEQGKHHSLLHPRQLSPPFCPLSRLYGLSCRLSSLTGSAHHDECGTGPSPDSCHCPMTIYYPLSVGTINPGPGNRDLSVLHY